MEDQVVRPQTEDELVKYLIKAGMTPFAAREWAAREFGTSKGSCVAVDKDGREWSLRELEEQGKLKKVS